MDDVETSSLPIQQDATTQAARDKATERISSFFAKTWTVWVTVVAQIAALWLYARQQHFTRLTDFIHIGKFFGGLHFGLSSLVQSYYGYDGQFYYYIARFPFSLPPGGIDLPPERYERILYPALIRALSLGHPSLMPWVMIGINLAATAGMVALMGWLLRERGLPVWLALVPGFYCGQALGVLRDLADPLVGFWLVAALVCMQRNRWLLAASAMALAMLTRETMLTFALCFAAPLVIERRWRLLAAYLMIAFIPFLAWQGFLYHWLGVWAFRVTLSDPSNALLHIPFEGLRAAIDPHLTVQFVLFACVPAVAGVVLGALALWERPWRDAVLLAAALGALVYGVAFTLQPDAHWLDIWAPMRLAMPFAILLPLLAPPRRLQPGWLALLALMIFSFTIALAPQ